MGTLQISSLPKPPWEEQSPANLAALNSSHKTTLAFLNQKCHDSLENLQQVHAYTLKTGLFRDHYIAGCLIKCYANPQFRCQSALFRVLQQVPEPNVFVWNSVIKGCLELELVFEVILLYSKMVAAGSKPNKYTYPQLFRACKLIAAIDEGLQIHGHVVKLGLSDDPHIVSGAIHMYAALGLLREARNMFDSSGRADSICCNALIDGYMKRGEVEAGLALFQSLEEKNVGSWNTVITGVFGCGMAEEARSLFDEMPERDEVSWSCVIDGYNKLGLHTEALEVFHELQRDERCNKFSKFILSSALSSCSNLGSLEQAKCIHGFIRKNRIVVDGILGTSLIDTYAKCGQLDLAWEVFDSLQDKQLSSWNAMMGAVAIHGRGEEATSLFSEMLSSSSLRPNEITFVSLLNACAHSGLIEEGLRYFLAMRKYHGIEPTIQHYGCMVNLLAKAGHIEEAEEFLHLMPLEPNSAVWGALLGACRLQGRSQLAEEFGEILLDMEPENSGRYALLSNVHAAAGNFDKVGEIRKRMKETGVRTVTGSSRISINGVVHEFRNGDSGHPDIKEIRLLLGNIQRLETVKGS